MVQAVKITSLNDIGTSIMYTTLVPVVNMTGTPTTEKANLQIVGNLILNGAGGSYFPPAAQATVAQFVAYAAQPNITSVGTLTSLNVSGNISAGNANLGNLAIANVFSGTLNGSAVSANIANTVTVNAQPNITSVGTLTSLNVTGPANLGAVTSLTITGGSPNYILQTNGTGTLSWVPQTTGSNTGNITFTAANISANIANRDIQIIGNGTGNVNVVANSQVWTFNADGNLTIPGNQGSIGTAYADGIDIIAPIGGYAELASGNLDNFIYVEEGGAYINTDRNGSDYQWHFDLNGGLTFPDSTFAAPDLEGTGDFGFEMPADVGFTILTDLGNNQWTFGADGYMRIPNDGSFGALNSSVLAFSSQNNVPIYIEVVDTSNNQARQWVFDNAGNLTLPGNTFAINYANGHQVVLNSSYISNGNSNVSLPQVNSNVYIHANGGTDRSWIFGTDGSTTFPNGAKLNNGTPNQFATDNTVVTSIDMRDTSGAGFYTNGSGYTLRSDGSHNWVFSTSGNLTIPGYVNLPLVGKLTSGGIGVNNSAEFGTNVTVNGSNVITGSQIYMGAGTAESRAIVNSTGNSLMYTGVENPGFAGMVSLDPGVTSEYAIQVGANNEIQIGAVIGPITTPDYVAGLGVLNDTGNINGIFANANVTVIGAGDLGWLFNSDGNLELPGTGTINNQANSSLDPTTPTASTMVLTPDSNYLYQALVLDPTSPGHIHLRSPATSGGNIDQPIANIFLGGELSSFEVGASYGGTPNVFIHSGGNTWTFGTDGNLTTPGVAGNITGANVISANTFVILGNTELGQIEGPNTAGFYNANAIDFLFELGTTNTWAFIGNTGGTLFPTITVQRGDTVDTITGQTLLFNDSTQEAIISTPNGDTNTNSSQRLVINPGEGYQGGEGGDIYLWAGRGGDASGSGGDIKIRGGLGGGNANGGTGGDGGYIRMEAGPGQGTGAAGWIEITSGAGGTGQNGGYVRILSGQGAINGGDANLTGGTGTAGVGGTVNIVGGASGLGLPDYGNVNIISGASTWRFDNTGNLTLPGEGIIKSNNDTVTLESYDVANTTSYGMYVGTTGGAYFFQGANPNWLSINPNLGNAEIYSGPGVSGGAGKNLSIAAGFADQGSFNTSPGGNLNLVAGLGGSNDGGGGGPGGSVNIAAGNSADPSGHAGNITINSGPDTWTFDYTGNLTTPGSIITAGSGGNITLTGGDITGVNIIVTTPTVLANLTAIAGARAFITDGNLVAAGGGSFGAQIGGGGSNICPVWSDGTNWYVG